MAMERIAASLAAFALVASAAGQCPSSAASCDSNAAAVRNASNRLGGDIVDTAVAAGNFKTLAAALKAAGLIDTLKGAGPFTVFAPTDEAFAKLPPGTVEKLLQPENKEKLAAILTYHVVPGAVLAADVVKLRHAATVNGQRVEITAGASSVTVDGATVIATDVKASNGVIHLIDAVILPNDKDILATASAAGNFTTLAAAINAAGLSEALSGPGPFTVFAPTDAAFKKLGDAKLKELLRPENKEKLAAILKLHVVQGRLFADEAVKAGSAKSLQGGHLTISSAGGVTVNGATVSTADIDASNGVIHVIESVILPK